MISKISYRIIGLIIQCGHLGGLTPYYWDNEKLRIRVSKSRSSIVCYYLSMVIVSTTFPFAFSSYLIHLNTFGFHMNDLKNIFRFLYVCVGIMIYIFQYQIFMKTKTTATIFNQITFFFSRIEG